MQITTGGRNRDHMNAHHGNSDSAVRGLQSLIGVKGDVEWKIFRRLQGLGDFFGVYQEWEVKNFLYNMSVLCRLLFLYICR